MSKAKRFLICCVMFMFTLLAITVKPATVHAAVNSNCKISTADKKKIAAIRTDLMTALATEVYNLKRNGRRYFCNNDCTEEEKFFFTVTQTELGKINKVVNNIPQEILLKYKNKKYDFINIVLWNFNTDNLKIYNLPTINKLSAKEIKYYVAFCNVICENAGNKYAKSVYGMSANTIYNKDYIVYKPVRSFFKEMNRLYPKEAEYIMQFKQDCDYYVIKEMVEDIGDERLTTYFNETESVYQKYYNSKAAQRARDCIRIYSVEQVNLNRKIISKPRYIADRIKKWDGKKPIKKFVG